MSTLKVTNIQATGETASRAVSGVAGSWINQQNDVSANNTNDSLNVSSNVDNGNGDSTFTVTNAFSSDTFVCTVGAGQLTTTDRFGQAVTQADGKQQSSSTYRAIAFDVSTSASGHIDSLNVICMGDLA